MNETIFFAILVLGLVLPPACARLWYWAGTMASIVVIVAAWELIALARTGCTISKMFGAWLVLHPYGGLLIAVAWSAVWSALLWHLWSMRKTRKEA